jgi:Mrp family chromosome partitioning ATPase
MNVLSRVPEDDAATATRISAIQQVKNVPPELAGLMSVLIRLLDRNGPIVVYLTAASHGEGTSTIARELAAAATRWDWCTVALIDASRPASDRRPLMSALIPASGLLDVPLDAEVLPFRRGLCDGAPLMQAALTGPATSLPTIETVRLLFDRLRKQFSLTIVDGPPVLMSQPISAFSAAADCVVLVVEAERTRIADLDRARARLNQLGARMLGVVLNKRRHWVPGFIHRRT